MKICQLCAVDFTLKRLIIPLVDAQLNQGHFVKSVCSFGGHLDDLKRKGYKIEVIPIERNLSPVKGLVSIWRLFLFFRRESFDVVHVHTPVAAFLARIAAFFARVPLVVYTAHGFYFHDEMPALKRLIFISAEIAMRPLTDLLLPMDKVVFGMVSRIVQENGIAEFLDAAKQLDLDYSHVYFLLVGSRLPSDYDLSVDSAIQVAETVLGNRLILAGEREDIPGLLASMDIFCLPSWREGMPRSIIEAMMMELPVVATNIRGSREEVIEGETGFLVPVKNVNRLHEKLEYLVNNPEIRKRIGRSGRSRAMRLYDEDVVINRQLELISKYTIND